MEGVEKRGLFVFGILVLFIIMFTGLSEAVVTCSDPSQVILRLSSATNAHGEIFADPGLYTEDICYNTIFGVLGSGDRTCTGSNKVVGLSGTTNAHAENPNLNNYATDICYGDLSCTARTGACLSGEFLVLSLSSSTNAHLVSDSSYSQNICCTAGPPPPTYCGDGTVQTPNDDGQNEECDGATNCISSGEVNECQCEPGFVSDGSGGCEASSCSITSASWSVTESEEDDLVDLDIVTSGCSDGTILSFVVWEDDLSSADDPVVTEPSDRTINGNSATGTWIAEWQEDKEFFLPSNPPEYYFIVTIVASGEDMQSSNELTVTPKPDIPYCNGVTICGQYYTNEGRTAEDSCNIDFCDVAEYSVEIKPEIPADFCDEDDIICFCEWDATDLECDSTWEEIPISDCGDGIIDNGEQCEGTNWGTVPGCTVFDEFTGGILNCYPPGHVLECLFDTTQCTGGTVGPCGNDKVDLGETCDGEDWGRILSCTDLDNFDYGNLDCYDPGHVKECQFDTSQCFRDGDPPVIGKCVYTETTSGSCETDGFLSSSWTAEWTGAPSSRSASCVDGQNVIECPAQIQLAFFNLYNMLITLLAIAGIYGIISLRKKH